jgi:hypothetical protein
VWCGWSRLESRTVRVLCGWSGLYSRTVCRTCRELHNCCLFSVFVAVCFSSMAFGLHLFCGGGYCGCVSLNIFSASFSWFSFALRRCNFCFWDRVNPDGHHRGMEYFGSAILMAVVSFFCLCWPIHQNHRSFNILMYDDICCTYFDDALFVVLSVAVAICPLSD